MFSTKVAPNKSEQFASEMEKFGMEKSEWVRTALSEMADSLRYWVRSKWCLADLDGKTVEFTLPLATGQSTPPSKGQFLVKQNPEGKLSIQICHAVFDGVSLFTEMRFPIPETGAAKIERHPDQSVAHFRMLA